LLCIISLQLLYSVAPPPSPKKLTGSGRFEKTAQKSPGEHLLHLLHSSYTPLRDSCIWWYTDRTEQGRRSARNLGGVPVCDRGAGGAKRPRARSEAGVRGITPGKFFESQMLVGEF